MTIDDETKQGLTEFMQILVSEAHKRVLTDILDAMKITRQVVGGNANADETLGVLEVELQRKLNPRR